MRAGDNTQNSCHIYAVSTKMKMLFVLWRQICHFFRSPFYGVKFVWFFVHFILWLQICPFFTLINYRNGVLTVRIRLSFLRIRIFQRFSALTKSRTKILRFKLSSKSTSDDFFFWSIVTVICNQNSSKVARLYLIIWAGEREKWRVGLTVLEILRVAVKRTVDIKNRPRIPIPDEDPYSVAGSGTGSSGSSSATNNGNSPTNGNGSVVAATREQLLSQQRSRDRPPKLPPRDNGPYPHDIPKVSIKYNFRNFRNCGYIWNKFW